MKTKYDTGDEVLMPATIKYAMTLHGQVMYAMENLKDNDGDILVPEGMIEGKAKIGKEKYWREQWEKKHKDN